MTHAYEDLTGGIGRSVYFRAKRYRARAALKETIPAVVLGDVAASLYDFSMTGLAVRVREVPANLPLGAVVRLSLMLNDIPAFSGRAQVVRAEGGSQWTTLGVRLLDGVLDPVHLQATRDRILLMDAVARGAGRYSDVGAEYRQLCGEAAFFLAFWRSNLDRLEAAEPIDRFSAEFHSEIEQEAETRMRSEWNEIRARGNDLTQTLSEDDPRFAAVKRYTEIQLTPLTLPAPIWKRAYEKPLGYPGDYVLMTYMYEEARRGTTTFSRVLHQLGREERLAATVPRRKELLVELIARVVRAKAEQGARAVNLLSIGAGPARELEDYIISDESKIPLVISLVDQDEDALAYACERLRRAVVKQGREVDIRARYIAFGQLLSRRDLLAELRGQDMIYSAGLMDYLSDRVAQNLLALCYDLAAPQSLLAFGNALSAPDVRWVPEFLLDWHMNYRSESDVLRLVEPLPRDAGISVKRDPSSAWCFVLVEKPAGLGER